MIKTSWFLRQIVNVCIGNKVSIRDKYRNDRLHTKGHDTLHVVLNHSLFFFQKITFAQIQFTWGGMDFYILTWVSCILEMDMEDYK